MSNLAIIGTKLNESISNVLSATQVLGFEKAFLIAQAVQELKTALTPEYMKPIMDLQGNRLGFKTDKDSSTGYAEPIVKNCLIEAVLTGVQPFGNQFNIIAGNMYITKEGFGYLLSNLKGLSYEIIPNLPRINNEKTSAAVSMKITYSLNGGQKQEKEIDIPVKMNAMMGTDAVIGKATRKARAWLYNTITGSEVADGDIADFDGKVQVVGSVISTKEKQAEQEIERVMAHINKAQTLKDLDDADFVAAVYEHNLIDALEAKKEGLKTAKK